MEIANKKKEKKEEEKSMECATYENSGEGTSHDNVINETNYHPEIINASTQTVVHFTRSQLIAYEFLNDAQLLHMTGFIRETFIFFCEHFGNSYCKIHSALSIQNELLITLMKYKLNLYFVTLESLFDIHKRYIKKIVTAWSKHLYKCLKQIDFWKPSTTSSGQYSVILDCTEFKIQRSSDPQIQQATYSNYYGTNTFKVLVGGTENGAIIYVSDVFGGCISDRKITEVSGFLDLVEEGQYILADRGFDISDVLEYKGVRLNIPPFKRKSQLTEEETLKTRAIANRRIIIENLIGLAKKFKILTDKIPVTLWPISNEIVYNCFMLCNFKNNIVNK